ncbi:hypothetical protein [Saccharothrix sp.]|uniref:hypothetical protein n=1 Tax=Saccharothrix sp. TaxID=1873460 RepID=UPI002810D281|nr:hypothetical protein [Saccharothrix sp.]
MGYRIACAAALVVAALAGCTTGLPRPTTTALPPATFPPADPTTTHVIPTTPERAEPTFVPPPRTSGTSNALAPPAAAGTNAPYTPQEFYGDYYTAIQVVDQYWTAHWGEHFTNTYQSPRMWTGTRYPEGMYEGGADAVFCGTDILKADNAYYCSVGDYIAFDINFLWRARYNGDMFVYMIVAHEWGHAIAARLNDQLKLKASELQADCFAGAALQGAARDGTLVIEPGDLEEVDVGLTDIADSSLWGKPEDHGAPDERIAFFNRGVRNGPLGCVQD